MACLKTACPSWTRGQGDCGVRLLEADRSSQACKGPSPCFMQLPVYQCQQVLCPTEQALWQVAAAALSSDGRRVASCPSASGQRHA